MTSLIIDAGNTRIKLATYVNDLLKTVYSFDDLEEFINHIKQLTYNNALVSSVLDDNATHKIYSALHSAILLNEKTPLPIQIDYDSITTLGKDRIANAVFANQFASKSNVLIIDMGTCIKFDFVKMNGIYKGGSISPGLFMRFKAMHHYTGKLPLINNFKKTKLIGHSTVNSMVSGVVNGIQYEIEGMINQYKKEFKDLIIFATGGDMHYFDFFEDLHIQQDEHLTINGLYTILKKQYEL